MAEPVRKDEPLSSMRFPESRSSKPGPVPVDRTYGTVNGRPLLPETATDQPLGAWPEETSRSSGEASQVLNGVMNAVKNTARKVPGFMHDRVDDLRAKFRVIRGRAESGELQDEMRDRANELRDEATRKARYARTRAQLYAKAYPFHFIAGAAAAGFAIGFLLRMWRDE